MGASYGGNLFGISYGREAMGGKLWGKLWG